MGGAVVSDLVLFPHCDLHIAMANTPQLTLKVFTRIDDPTQPGRYRLDPANIPSITFMAPHQAKPNRFANLPTVNGTVITATALGLYLFVVQVGNQYQVGRLQVHHDITAWWFGNDSVTTAVDPTLGHTQPSIYAKFSDDAGTGTDLIGDITGHGYVPLTTTDPNKVVVTLDGRLRGVVETTAPVNISGTFRGQTANLPVRVVNYGKVRTDLAPVRISGLADHGTKHNMVFLAEGFRDTSADRDLFNEIVEKAANDLLEKPRHEPYPMLAGSFNIFKAFVPSQQHTLTCGFRVSDTGNADVPVPAGLPIPYNGQIDVAKTNIYAMDELIQRVGLPMRGENRPNLPALWGGQNLTGFDPAKVDDQLVDAWKLQQSVGILHARDTFFGMHLGNRWADRRSGSGPPLPALPNGDNSPAADVQAVVARMYEFYTKDATRTLSADPRRHPPELSAGWPYTNPVNVIMNYLVNLQYQFPPNDPIGQDWFPDDTTFKPSRGLVALIVNDGMIGGTNFNNRTITAQTLSSASSLKFQYSTPPGAPADKREMRRQPPDTIDADIDGIINTVAHEFGHSFNLDDEYEDTGGADPRDTSAADFTADNVTHLNFIRLGASPSTQIDPTKVKWFALQRIRLSDRLQVASTVDTGGIKVTIDPRHMAHWVEAQQSGAKVSLRAAHLGATGQQLPLSGQHLDNLTIRADINQAAGTFVLVGASAPIPQFPAGALVFVPRLDANNAPLLVVEPKVLQFLRGPGAGADMPLNQDTDTAHVNTDADHPVSISGFKGPCKSARLVGIFEGAEHFAAGAYRPTGACKMRSSRALDEGGEFCFVCKWLIVNLVDPGFHSVNDALFYPKAKKNG